MNARVAFLTKDCEDEMLLFRQKTSFYHLSVHLFIRTFEELINHQSRPLFFLSLNLSTKTYFFAGSDPRRSLPQRTVLLLIIPHQFRKKEAADGLHPLFSQLFFGGSDMNLARWLSSHTQVLVYNSYQLHVKHSTSAFQLLPESYCCRLTDVDVC